MIDSKYYEKKVTLIDSIEADLILIDVSKEHNPWERFIVTIEAGQTITIKGPVTYEFHKGATGILRTNYYPKDGFLFDIKGAQITSHIGSRTKSGNLFPVYEVQFASKDLIKLITGEN